MLSLAQSSIASLFAMRRSARRLVVVTLGDKQPLLPPLANRFEVTCVIRADECAGEELAARLSPRSLSRDRVYGIIVIANDFRRLPTALLLQCQLDGIRVFDEHTFYEQEIRSVDVDADSPNWLWARDKFRNGLATVLRKRLLDLLIATVVLVLAFPLMLLIAALIKYDSRGPVLYRQERVGFKGRTFTLYKFRSMREDAEIGGVPEWAALSDPRVTRIGSFIRYTRMDELPQLINVLRGEMSVIGPRPERPYFVEKLTSAIPLYCARHYVKPGITGWAQVNAPYGASIDDSREKLRYDLYYIKHCSLLLDIIILFRTLRVIILREGAR